MTTIALLGCGWAGRRHALAYSRAGAHLGWAVDTDLERAKALAANYPGCRAAVDYDQALQDPRIDAVDICLPHDLHAPVAVEAAQAGKHVLVEKPLAATLEEADRMIDAAERANVTLMVAENVHFRSEYLEIRKLLQAGAIGQPALIQMTRQAYLRESFLRERAWFLDARAAAGGIMMSGGIHDFETMHLLVGEIESVHALRARQRFLEMEGDDTSVALIRFRNGAAGTLVESFIMKSLITATGPEVHTLRIDGDDGSLSVRTPSTGTASATIRLFSERAEYRVNNALAEHEIYVPEADSFQAEIEHFLDCLRTGREPITSGHSQRRPLEVVLAAYRSMETGRPVSIGLAEHR
jgi:UDP-N-acetyl-2-amino-2-deoxyglucuronate dehydrogenase